MYQQIPAQPQGTATTSFTSGRTGLLQRRCACGGTPGPDGECAECRTKRSARQARSMAQTEPSEVPPIVNEVLRSPGQIMRALNAHSI